MSESMDQLVSCRPKYSIKRISVASLTCYMQLHQPVLGIKINRCVLLSNVTETGFSASLLAYGGQQ